jgi:hypothetical protein
MHNITKTCPVCDRPLMVVDDHLACRGLDCTYREPLPAHLRQQAAGQTSLWATDPDDTEEE